MKTATIVNFKCEKCGLQCGNLVMTVDEKVDDKDITIKCPDCDSEKCTYSTIIT